MEDDIEGPILTSSTCYDALVDFFADQALLSVAAEASSHPSGLDAVYAQPWVYAGGGLGNMQECPLEVCIAGSVRRDSISFASVCVVPECSALDLAARDFPGRLETAAFNPEAKKYSIADEYVTLHKRIAKLNKFLKTGWICGQYSVEWQPIHVTIYSTAVLVVLVLVIAGTFYKRRTTVHTIKESNSSSWQEMPVIQEMGDPIQERTKDNNLGRPHRMTTTLLGSWNLRRHWKSIFVQRPDTAFLDGLKVLSILWVISGHLMAIQTSSGGGYLNPKDFLPPDGITTTFLGQLLFSSRFAVDTFLCIGGYLAIRVLKRKISGVPKYSTILGIMALRVLRIFPLYALVLGFWVLIAPHLGSGPFWYQWIGLLEPCNKLWWTNILFINNVFPANLPITASCFYHSWYLAVDVQLFCIFAPFLVIQYHRSKKAARSFAAIFWALSVAVTAYMSYRRKWSINTFDGAAVARFDVEGYARPYIRAQSYLAGCLIAMMPLKREKKPIKDIAIILVSLIGIAFVTFITVRGAYSRRACRYEEWPSEDDCGSTWERHSTFLYTAFSRAIWSICIALLLRSFLEGKGGMLRQLLAWKLWTPLSHFSFGAYLIHPIVIFVWQLSSQEKSSFQLLSFCMDFISVTVMSFAAAAVACLAVELPMAAMTQNLTRSDKNDDQARDPIQEHSYQGVDTSDFPHGDGHRPTNGQPSKYGSFGVASSQLPTAADHRD